VGAMAGCGEVSGSGNGCLKKEKSPDTTPGFFNNTVFFLLGHYFQRL